MRDPAFPGRWAMGVVLLLVTGCAGQQLALETRQVHGQLRTARDNGAYRCAPRELARAEANVEFAERELDRGEYFRAKDHLELARASVDEAVRMSPAGRCVDPLARKPRPHPITPESVTPVQPRNDRGVDTDGDGIADIHDRCPLVAEDRDGFEDEDGCPEADNDKDGIPDPRDNCPTDAEDKDGFEDDDGCPDPDNDRDGVPDVKDHCPGQAEDRDGFEDDDGCPEPDNDRDGIPDASDKCPNQPGPPDGGGCPVELKLVAVTQDRIELKQAIFFATGKATILARSYALLDEVAEVLRNRPAMAVRIEGHTDRRGSRSGNLRLSQARADSVKAYLLGKGIESGRMDARGYGPDQPIETNKTAAGRERNRRVEFVITQR